MSLRINGLITLNAVRQLSSSYNRINKITERLLGGGQAYNPVAVSLTTQVSSDLASINQKITDANLSVSMNQTADGALGGVGNVLVRMKQLAQQAASGAYSETQISAMNDEYQSLGAQISDTIASTQFNDITLLTGDDALVSLDLAEVLAIDLTDVPETAASVISVAIADTSAKRASLGAQLGALDANVQGLQNQSERLTAFQDRISSMDVAMTIVEQVNAEIQTLFDTWLTVRSMATMQLALKVLTND